MWLHLPTAWPTRYKPWTPALPASHATAFRLPARSCARWAAGPVTIREAARRAQRDVKAVHSDVQALLACGVLDKTADGKIEFGYDAVRVDFLLKAA
jgi:hypothetical protein